MWLNGQILSQLNIPVHIPFTELRWFYIQEELNSFQKFISMFVASNLTPRTFEILLSVSSLHNIIAGDLWAKRGERGILREVQNEYDARATPYISWRLTKSFTRFPFCHRYWLWSFFAFLPFLWRGQWVTFVKLLFIERYKWRTNYRTCLKVVLEKSAFSTLLIF